MKVKSLVIAALFESVKSVKLDCPVGVNCHHHHTHHSFNTVHHHHTVHHHDHHHADNSGIKAILGTIIGVNPSPPQKKESGCGNHCGKSEEPAAAPTATV